MGIILLFLNSLNVSVACPGPRYLWFLFLPHVDLTAKPGWFCFLHIWTVFPFLHLSFWPVHLSTSELESSWRFSASLLIKTSVQLFPGLQFWILWYLPKMAEAHSVSAILTSPLSIGVREYFHFIVLLSETTNLRTEALFFLNINFILSTLEIHFKSFSKPIFSNYTSTKKVKITQHIRSLNNAMNLLRARGRKITNAAAPAPDLMDSSSMFKCSVKQGFSAFVKILGKFFLEPEEGRILFLISR